MRIPLRSAILVSTTLNTPTILGWNQATTVNAGAGGVYNNDVNEPSPPDVAFAGYDNPGYYQLSGYQIQPGDQFTLTYYARNLYQGPQAEVKLIDAASQSSQYSDTSVVATSTPVTAPVWTQYTLTYTATPSDVGKFVGVQFAADIDAPTNGYVSYDSFVLNVTSTPEPASVASLAFCSLGLLARRRRQA